MWYLAIMSMDDSIAKLILKQVKLVTALVELVASQAVIINDLVAKCQHSGCTDVAFFRHQETSTLMCDRHAAETIIASSDDTTDQENALKELRRSLANEDSWREVPHADAIRRNNEYVISVKQILDKEGSGERQ